MYLFSLSIVIQLVELDSGMQSIISLPFAYLLKAYFPNFINYTIETPQISFLQGLNLYTNSDDWDWIAPKQFCLNQGFITKT